MTYADGNFQIVANTTKESNVGTYPIKIVVTDTAGSVLSKQITLLVMSAIQSTSENKTSNSSTAANKPQPSASEN